MADCINAGINISALLLKMVAFPMLRWNFQLFKPLYFLGLEKDKIETRDLARRRSGKMSKLH